MTTKELVQEWFRIWTNGDFENLPLADTFKHTSPYGLVEGKEKYMDLVISNREMFLGNRFEIHDELYLEDKACIRYSMHSPKFSMEVSEWQYMKDGLIQEIVAYYNIEGEISEERQLKDLDE